MKVLPVFDVTIYLLIIVLWSITIYFYQDLPEKIAIHFDFNNQADGFGKRAIYFLSPSLFSVLSLAFLCIPGDSELMNYAVEITPQNKERQQCINLVFLRCTIIWMLALGIFIQYHIYLYTIGIIISEVWTWIILAVFFGMFGVYYYIAKKNA